MPGMAWSVECLRGTSVWMDRRRLGVLYPGSTVDVDEADSDAESDPELREPYEDVGDRVVGGLTGGEHLVMIGRTRGVGGEDFVAHSYSSLERNVEKAEMRPGMTRFGARPGPMFSRWCRTIVPDRSRLVRPWPPCSVEILRLCPKQASCD